MRSLTDLVQEEPVALTAFVAALVNVFLLAGVHVTSELVSSINILIATGFGAVRWLVVPNVSVADKEGVASAAGYADALTDVKSLV